MKKPSKAHIITATALTMLSPIFLPIFCEWYKKTTGIEPIPIYTVFTCVGIVSWGIILFKSVEGE